MSFIFYLNMDGKSHPDLIDFLFNTFLNYTRLVQYVLYGSCAIKNQPTNLQQITLLTNRLGHMQERSAESHKENLALAKFQT